MEGLSVLMNNLEMRRSIKAIGLFGMFLDMWYPWLSLCIGTIPWNAFSSSGDGGSFSWSSDSESTIMVTILVGPSNIFLAVCLTVWSMSAVITFLYSISCDRQLSGSISLDRCESDRELHFVAAHLLIAFSGSLLQCVSVLKSGDLGYLAFTLVFRIVQLGCVLMYIRELINFSRKVLMISSMLSMTISNSGEDGENKNKNGKTGKKQKNAGAKKIGEGSNKNNHVIIIKS